jgi:hypothetical protein
MLQIVPAALRPHARREKLIVQTRISCSAQRLESWSDGKSCYSAVDVSRALCFSDVGRPGLACRLWLGR